MVLSHYSQRLLTIRATNRLRAGCDDNSRTSENAATSTSETVYT